MKILTDIEIQQSNMWCENTVNVDDLNILNLKMLHIRYLKENVKPIINAMIMIKNMKNYDAIVTGFYRTGMLIGLFRKLFRIKYSKHIVLELIYNENRSRILWKIKKLFKTYILSSIDLIIVSSTSEIDIYSKRLRIKNERIKYVPFHTNIINPRIVGKDCGYILSAGKEGRDYAVLCDAVKNMDFEILIVSDNNSIKGITFSNNVRVFIDIPYLEYIKLLEKCLFVIVPLKNVERSTGQVAILEAMALGKPVIASKTIGVLDYIQHEENGILVKCNDSNELKKAISNLMGNINLRKKISENALYSIMKYHTFDIYVQNILKSIKDVI